MSLSPGSTGDGGDATFNQALTRMFAIPAGTSEQVLQRQLNQYTDDECDEFDSPVPPMVRQAHPTVEDVGAPYSGWAKADRQTVLEYEDIKLVIPSGALLEDTRLTIRPIPDRDAGALDEGMTNVVPGKRAFRLGPHGLFFQKPVTLIVPYDRSLIPAGMSEEDLATLYFDEESGRWRRIRVREVSSSEAVAETEHFTDFINATIAVPDHPTAASFDQNTIANLKLGDPAAGLELISPPVASSDGAAHLSYPLTIPPGRRGMQPDLALQYNSNGGNGWLGQGWDIPISKITVDTRFGVPRYSGTQESELYLIDGAELTPVGATQGPGERALSPQAREPEREFVRRGEGSFSKIIRHGSAPRAGQAGAYTWEVVDKNGIHYFYGTGTWTTLQAPGTGAIGEWLLARVEDPYGNRIDYEYQSDSAQAPLGGAQEWTQLYPALIRYTSTQSTLGSMFIKFELEPAAPGNPEPFRPDTFSSAREGFLVRTQRRLHAIYVVSTPHQFAPDLYNGQLTELCTLNVGDADPCDELVRRYLFSYSTGEYQKSLLQYVDVQTTDHSIPEVGDYIWVTEHRHTFDYYRRPDGQSPKFSAPVPWGTIPNTQTLASSDGESGGTTVYTGAGICGLGHAGGGGGFQKGTEDGKQAFFDFNGDGLPDFLGNGQVFLGHRSPAAPITSVNTPIVGNFFSTSQWGFSATVAKHSLADTQSLGYTWSWNNSGQKGGFADVNGDGYVDWVRPSNAAILWNRGGWGSGGGSTEEGGALDLPETSLDPVVLQQIEAQSPRADTIVRWTAPYTGTVRLSGTIQRASSAPGDVRAEILHGNDSVWVRTLSASDMLCAPSQSNTCNGSALPDLQVLAGDRFYFRTRAEGSGMENTGLHWDPQFSYQSVCGPFGCTPVTTADHARVEPWGAPVFDFSQAADFRLAGPPDQPWQAKVLSLSGPLPVRISGAFKKLAATADDITVEVFKTRGPLDNPEVVGEKFVRRISASETIEDLNLGPEIEAALTETPVQDPPPLVSPLTMNVLVGADNKLEPEALHFQVHSDSPVDPAAIEWNPVITYQKFCRNPIIENGAQVCGDVVCPGTEPESACDMAGDPMPPENPLRRGLIVYDAPVTYSTYLVEGKGDNAYLTDNQPTEVYPAPASGEFVDIRISYSLAGTVPGGEPEPPGSGHEAVLLVQGNQRLLAKLIVQPGTTELKTIRSSGPVTVGEPLYFTALRKGDQSFGYQVELLFPGSSLPIPVPLSALNVHRVHAWNDSTGEREDPLSGGYHQWSTGQWTELSSAPEFSGTAVEESYQGLQSETAPTPPVAPTIPRRNGVSPNPLLGLPGYEGPVWVSNAIDLYIGAGFMKPSRSGTDPEAVGRLSKGKDFRKSHGNSQEGSITLGLPGVAGIAAGWTESESSGDADTIDLNGDQYPDWLNGNEVHWGNSQGGLIGPVFLGSGSEVRKIEGDTYRYDISSGVSAGVQQRLNGKGESSATVSISGSVGKIYGRNRTRSDLVDVNGDGLPDRVERPEGSSSFKVRLNLGYSFGPAYDLPATPEFPGVPAEVGDFSTTEDSRVLRLQTDVTNNVGIGLGAGYSGAAGSVGGGIAWIGTRTVVDFADVNGDGLLDRVLKKPGDSALHVQLNLGEKFAPDQPWLLPAWGAELPPGGPLGIIGSRDTLAYSEGFDWNLDTGGSYEFSIWLFICGIVEQAIQYRKTQTTSQLVFQDVDGDGYADQLLKNDGSGSIYVKLNEDGALHLNLLKTVENPIGGRITLDYSREGNTEALPENRWVLSSVSLDDGLTNGFHDAVRTTTFQYAGGLYSRLEREFLGFAGVTTVRPDQSTIYQSFRQDAYCTKGLLTSTVERDGAGHLFRRVQTEYEIQPTPAVDSCFPAPITETTDFYDGVTTDLNQPSKTTADHREYDAFGNVTFFRSDGDTGSADDVSYTIVYDPNPELASRYIFRPQTVTAVDGQNTVLRQRTATYHPEGSLYTLHDLVNGGHDPATGAPYVNQVTPDWVFTYNGFGLLETSMEPTGFQLQYTYDDVTHSYIVSTTDSFGYTSTQIPDPRIGVYVSITDINGFTEQFEYDRAIPRLKTVWAPGPTPEAELNDVIYVRYSSLCPGTVETCFGGRPKHLPANTLVRHLDEGSLDPTDRLETVTFIDGLGRTIQVKKEADIDNGAGGVTHGFSVTGLTVYDARGRVQAQGQPTFSSDPVTTTLVAPTFLQPTQYQYDILSRPTAVTEPNSGVTTTVYGFAPFDGIPRFTTTVTDPNNNTRVTYQDVRGQVVGIEQFNTIDGINKTLTTRYKYDALGELLEVKDAKNNVTTAVYDTVGHLVDLTSPDSGHTSYRYDLAGRLKAKQTPKLAAANQVITFGYNANRLETIDLPGTPNLIDFQYTFGDPEDPEGERGRLVHIDDPSGHEDRFYDQLGRVNASAFKPARQSQYNPIVTYTTYFTYDYLNRLLAIDYPDREIVTYGYDQGGALKTVTGKYTGGTPTSYVQNITYDHFGQRKSITLGNGVVTRYSYDPAMRWLTDLDTVSGATTIQANHYTFDLVGNIQTAANEIPIPAPVPPNGPIAPGPTSQTFTYDKLYQLTGSTGRYDGCACGCNNYRQYTFSQTYDEIGNIKQKTVTDNIYWPNGQIIAQPKTTYSNTYLYQTPRPHAPSKIGVQNLTYDADGNQLASTGTFEAGREITWNELDQLTKEIDSGYTNTYLYNSAGERTHKRRTSLETVYVNQYYVIRNLLYQTKHIYAGPTRVATATKTLSSYNPPGGSAQPVLYYYHSDHLGSTGYLTDKNGVVVEHEEYLPSGEAWFEELRNGSATNRLPWQFNGKELDETGLYYYGARYYNPRAGVWMSPDPVFSGYFAATAVTGQPKEQDPSGIQGAPPPLMSQHLGLYTYVNNNPVNASDPDGNYARIHRSGNSVRIVIPVLFRNEGTMSEKTFRQNVERFTSGIERTWSGKFGKFEVRTSVQILSEAEAKEISVQGGGLNVVSVQDASSYAGADLGHASVWSERAFKEDAETGEVVSNFSFQGVSAEGRGDLLADASAETAAHEAGHLLGLEHETAGNRQGVGKGAKYDKANTMTPIPAGRQSGSRPSEAQIDYITGRYCQNCKK